VNDPDVSIILPCAGFGTRFGAPYAKELHCLAPGVTVLDRSLEPAVELVKSGLSVRVVVVFGTHKLDTVKYLARYAGTVQLGFVLQDDVAAPGLDGAIRCALPMTRGPVALVLPDIVVSDVGSLLAAVRQADWSVVAAKESDPVVLRQMGALTVSGGDGVVIVEAAAEKPADASGFNALWGTVVVAEEEAHRLPDVARRDADSPLAGARAFMVERIVNYNTTGG
jgi:UTP-glucose-1-phosphate uridylyltransferase